MENTSAWTQRKVATTKIGKTGMAKKADTRKLPAASWVLDWGQASYLAVFTNMKKLTKFMLSHDLNYCDQFLFENASDITMKKF